MFQRHSFSIVRDLVMEMFAVFEPPNMIVSLRRFLLNNEWVVPPLLFDISDILCVTPVQNQLSANLLPKNIELKIHRTRIFLVVLCGSETWFATLREEHSLRVFENKILRKVSGPEREKIKGERKGLHNELCDLYCSPNIVQVIT